MPKIQTSTLSSLLSYGTRSVTIELEFQAHSPCYTLRGRIEEWSDVDNYTTSTPIYCYKNSSFSILALHLYSVA